jgi:hypothetical protein
MKMARQWLLAALCLGTSGCWLDGKKVAVTAPTPPPAPQPAAQQPVPALPPLPVATATPEPPPPPPPPVAENPEPVPTPAAAPTPPPPKRVVAKRKPSPLPPTSTESPPPASGAAPVPPPALREIISGDQRRQYESEFRQDVGRAGSALKQAATRPLNAGQRETVARIQTFLSQANLARDNDISTALQLARRADLLGQELLKSMK